MVTEVCGSPIGAHCLEFGVWEFEVLTSDFCILYLLVDVKFFVIHSCITMKTATVRDLRNHFADIAKWIESGEQVTITRNGVAFATLAPAKPQRRRKVDWTTRLKRYKPAGRRLSKEETEAFWSTLRD